MFNYFYDLKLNVSCDLFSSQYLSLGWGNSLFIDLPTRHGSVDHYIVIHAIENNVI